MSSLCARSALLCLALTSGCYAHTRRDAPAPAPSEAASDMISIPPGTFTMGDNNGEPDEYPERQISMSGYRIDRTEVTNTSYRLCVEAKACDSARYLDDPALGKPNHPVVGVTYDDANRYCAWVGRRLPTESEWEYAAKGPELRKWPWKGAFDATVANTVFEDPYEMTSPVGAFPDGESSFGVLDMAGNAAEWVLDYFDPTFYRTTDQTSNPPGPPSGRERVVRGGSYRDSSHLVRAAARRAKLPTESDNTIGFRCAAD